MPAAHTATPYSRLYLVGDNAPWVLSEEVRALERIALQLGIPAEAVTDAAGIHAQAVFYVSRYALFETLDRPTDNRLGLAYFHGAPGTGHPEFDSMFDRLRAAHRRIHRVQVSYSAMERTMWETGIEKAKVHRIPLGIALELFPVRTQAHHAASRAALGIPEGAFVVGSFQKDGNGWGDGLEPKLIKGPDVFLRVMAAIRPHCPSLLVLLTGPSRGYVKRGLGELGIPFIHVPLDRYDRIAACYHALDAYCVASRQEGGPKAILESMAAGVPLVTTAVGQAIDIVRHGTNGWMSMSEDVADLAAGLRDVHAHPVRWQAVTAAARMTAEEHSYDRQLPLWRKFFDGFVQPGIHGAAARWQAEVTMGRRPA